MLDCVWRLPSLLVEGLCSGDDPLLESSMVFVIRGGLISSTLPVLGLKSPLLDPSVSAVITALKNIRPDNGPAKVWA